MIWSAPSPYSWLKNPDTRKTSPKVIFSFSLVLKFSHLNRYSVVFAWVSQEMTVSICIDSGSMVISLFVAFIAASTRLKIFCWKPSQVSIVAFMSET